MQIYGDLLVNSTIRPLCVPTSQLAIDVYGRKYSILYIYIYIYLFIYIYIYIYLYNEKSEIYRRWLDEIVTI